MLGRFLGPELVSDNRSLILEGPPGTGKTHLCIAIAYKAIQKLCRSFHHCRCLSTSCTRVVTLITLLKAIPIHMYWSLMKWATWDMVQTQQIFSSKVNLRYQKGKPILFTTNKSLKQWGRVLHDEELARAILDRTLHYGEHIRLNGQSYRLRGRRNGMSLPSRKDSRSMNLTI